MVCSPTNWLFAPAAADFVMRSCAEAALRDPHDRLSDDPAVHARAWADLAPSVDDLTARGCHLSDLCVSLFREGRSADDVFLLWLILREYVDDDTRKHVGRNRQLAADARVVVPRLKRALREVIRIHRDAADRNPFHLPDATRRAPWWSECQRRYEDTLNTIDIDPTLARPIFGVTGTPRTRRELSAHLHR